MATISTTESVPGQEVTQQSLTLPPVWTPNKLAPGYPQLAERMRTLPESAIVRRFGSLNTQNILYLQTELLHLERGLRQLECGAETNHEDGRAHQTPLCPAWVSAEPGGMNDPHNKLFKKIREKLKEYKDAVLQNAAMMKLPDATASRVRLIDSIASRMEGPVGGSQEVDWNVWKTAEELNEYQSQSDLLCLTEQKQIIEDPLSELLKGISSFVRPTLLRRKAAKQPDQERDAGQIASMAVKPAAMCERSISHTAHWITTLLAALLPLAGIMVLWPIRRFDGQLAAIAANNFTIFLRLLTRTKPAECFPIVMAFTAIQVVFVAVTYEGDLEMNGWDKKAAAFGGT